MGHSKALGKTVHPDEQTLDHVMVAFAHQPDFIYPAQLLPCSVYDAAANQQVELEPPAHPDPGILSMIFSLAQSSAWVAPVAEAGTLSLTLGPASSTHSQRIRTSLLPPVIRSISRPTRGPIRRARGSGPTRSVRTTGRAPSRGSASTPATFVIRSPWESISCLSTRSRISRSSFFTASLR